MIKPTTTTSTTSSTSSNQEQSTMKAAMLHKIGDATTSEVLSVVEGLPIPEPREGQILIKVGAAAINPIDWKRMTGDLPGGKPGRVGSDVAGVVAGIGPNTSTQLKAGDEIYADAIGTKGSFGEYLIATANVVSKKPKNISMAEAASLPLAGLTAVQGLVNHGNLQKGQRVLVMGGSGGVGSLVIQMAKALGASEVYATGSQVETTKSFGADVVVNYREESLMDALKGKDFDLVYDTIGGKEHWEVGQAALKKEGGVFLTINLDGSGLVCGLSKAVYRTVKGKLNCGPEYKLFFADTKYEGVASDMAKMTELVESGMVKPVMDGRRFDLTTEGMHNLIKASQSHRAQGKLVLQVQKD